MPKRIYLVRSAETNVINYFSESSHPEGHIQKVGAETRCLGQNICRFFQGLARFLFTASETELDYYHQKVNVRVAERLSTWDLKKLGNFIGNSTIVILPFHV